MKSYALDGQLSFFDIIEEQAIKIINTVTEKISEITEPETFEEILLGGTGTEGGKFRIEKFYRTNNPANKEFASMIKSEYGCGGKSSRARGYSIDYINGKGITLNCYEDKSKNVLYTFLSLYLFPSSIFIINFKQITSLKLLYIRNKIISMRI